MREPVPASFAPYISLAEADIYYQPQYAVALVQTKANFIPMKSFQLLFNQVKELAAEQTVARVLFDKRSLTIFHQPSMEWYYLQWKDYMIKEYSLLEHGKILPKDDLFRQSVKQAREKIFSNNPLHGISRIDLLYFESLAEALQHYATNVSRNK